MVVVFRKIIFRKGVNEMIITTHSTTRNKGVALA